MNAFVLVGSPKGRNSSSILLGSKLLVSTFVLSRVAAYGSVSGAVSPARAWRI